jgi:phage replication-related protein YjqB (UPF0714/DUF867 family)
MSFKGNEGDAQMHHHLPAARADWVDDACALLGACHLRNERIVSIHAYSSLYRKARLGGRERRKRKEITEQEPTLKVEEDARLLVRAAAHGVEEEKEVVGLWE